MTTGILAIALDVSVVVVAVAMVLCVWRLVRGPQSIDRARYQATNPTLV